MSERFDIIDTAIAGLKVLHRKPLGDHRGFLERVYCSSELADATGGKSIAQINRTLTAEMGTVRGLHYQNPPATEIKLVSCLKGEVFDVAVDIRQDSPTFLQWHAEVLSVDNHKTLLIPEGFAHGFQTLTEDCEMLYFHTAAYDHQAEAALNVADPSLAIQWPLPIKGLSERDASHPSIDSSFSGIAL